MLTDQINEPVDGFVFRDIEFHGRFADVEIDLSGGSADVAEIGIGHFAGSIDDAAHHGDADPLEVTGGGADFLGGGLQIEEGTAAAWAGHVVGFEDADTGGLKDIVGKAEALAGGLFALHDDGIADAIAEQAAEMGGGPQQRVDEGGFGVVRWMEGILEKDGMPFPKARCEEPETGNDRMRVAIGNGHEDRIREAVDPFDGFVIERIHGKHATRFKHNLRLEFAKAGELVSDRVVLCLGGDDTDSFRAAEGMLAYRDAGGGPAAVAEGIP